ncbi:hypothetical protein PYCCODRAFT_548967 [Trametes coccinea BRFM310]|uniref:Uncharacterized protein n=1 Tax=Trametes coccinea (strain BRFM310) TaxID=1353009 RepID=A0A1Y2IJ09_TRAC3|nr:hypothetical protein PYCCODRAFT_548967 [Trametes coccinea BRFM310]
MTMKHSGRMRTQRTCCKQPGDPEMRPCADDALAVWNDMLAIWTTVGMGCTMDFPAACCQSSRRPRKARHLIQAAAILSFQAYSAHHLDPRRTRQARPTWTCQQCRRHIWQSGPQTYSTPSERTAYGTALPLPFCKLGQRGNAQRAHVCARTLDSPMQ